MTKAPRLACASWMQPRGGADARFHVARRAGQRRVSCSPISSVVCDAFFYLRLFHNCSNYMIICASYYRTRYLSRNICRLEMLSRKRPAGKLLSFASLQSLFAHKCEGAGTAPKQKAVREREVAIRILNSLAWIVTLGH